MYMLHIQYLEGLLFEGSLEILGYQSGMLDLDTSLVMLELEIQLGNIFSFYSDIFALLV